MQNHTDTDKRYAVAADLFARTETILIQHPLLVQAHKQMNMLVRDGQLSSGREKKCMPLIAPPGCGKTTILRNFVAGLNASQPLTPENVPALYVALKPTVGKKSIAQDILWHKHNAAVPTLPATQQTSGVDQGVVAFFDFTTQHSTQV